MTTQTGSSPATGSAPAAGNRRLATDLRQYGILAALVVIIGLFEVLTGGRLLMPGNVNNLIQQNSYVLILAIGMVMVIIAGHIDLSVGSAVAMIGAVAALAMSEWHLPWWLAVIVSLLVGAVVGAWQGFWVALMGIPAFIVTLAGMLLFRGLTLIFLHGGTIGGLPNEFVAIGAGWLPSWLGKVGRVDVLTLVLGLLACAALVALQLVARAGRRRLDLPVEGAASFWVKIALAVVAIMAVCWQLANYSGTPIILIILAVLVVAYSFLLNRTVFGRNVYAIGSNPEAARLAGVNVDRVTMICYGLCALCAGIAGLLLVGSLGAADPSAGLGNEFFALTAVLLGGTRFSGGAGTLLGTLLGLLFLIVLSNILLLSGLPQFWIGAVQGVVLLVAVGIDRARRDS